MKYLVLQSFVSRDIAGTKNKHVIINDKEFAKTLINAKIIAKISDNRTDRETNKEIEELNATISLLNEKNTKLEAEKEELIKKINSFEKISDESKKLEDESNEKEPEKENVNENLDDKSILNTKNN